MKIIHIITAAVIASSGCASDGIRTLASLETRVSETASKLDANKDPRAALKGLSGKSKGYFYLLNSNGRIEYHPVKGLLGSDFSRYGFVKNIIKIKKGCIRSDAGNISRIVIFRETAGGGILCYTIPENEVTGTERCKTFRKEEAE